MAQATGTLGKAGTIAVPAIRPRKTYTLWELAFRRFLRHRAAVAGTIGLTLIILFVIIGSFVYSEEYANTPDVINRLHQPTWLDSPATFDHLFGTDSTGRDIFARIIYGGQISLIIG